MAQSGKKIVKLINLFCHQKVFDGAFFELIRMLMSKNVNNDVNKDLPIFTSRSKKKSFPEDDK